MTRHKTFMYENDFFAYEANQPDHTRIAEMVATVQRMGHNSKEHMFAVYDGEIMVVYSKGKDPLLDEIRICKILSLASTFASRDAKEHSHGNELDILNCPTCRPTKRQLKSQMRQIIEI